MGAPEEQGFAHLGFAPAYHPSHRMYRDSKSGVLDAKWDVFSTLACYFVRDGWPAGCGAFVAFHFGGENAELCAGAYHALDDDLTAGFANSSPPGKVGGPASHLVTAGAARLPELTVSKKSVWKYESRPWGQDVGRETSVGEEINWALQALEATLDARAQAKAA
jgi:hypothetical protein